MRIPSGKTDQYIYFVAVDATDLVSRETGLSSFTVYRSRNGVAEVAYTTPTVTQIDATNMPGVYALLIDEDTTIASTSDSEEYCLHITHSGMAPVTRTIELYRRTVTTGTTALVDANGRVDVIKVAGTTQTAGDLAAMITAVDDFVDTEIGTITTNLATANGKLDTIDDFLDTEIAAIKAKTDNLPTDPADASDIAAAFSTVNGKLDTIDDFLDTEVAAIKAKTDNLPSDPADASDISTAFGTVNSTLATIAGYIDTEVAAIKAKTDNLPASPAATGDIISAATIADAVWDEILSGHAGVGSTGAALSAAGGSGDPWATALPGAYGAGTAGQIVGDYLDVAVSSVSGGSGLDAAGVRAAIGMASANMDTQLSGLDTKITAVDDLVDTEVGAIKTVVDAIKVSTDALPSDPADASVIAAAFAVTNGKIDTVDDFLDTEIAAIKAKTDNLPADPADASDIAGSFTTVNGKLDTIDDFLDTEVAAIKAKTDNLPASPAATSDIPTANQNADALLDRSAGIETGYTPRQTIRLMAAVLLGKSSGHPGSPVYRNMPDTADRVTATVSSGNRSAVTLNP